MDMKLSLRSAPWKIMEERFSNDAKGLIPKMRENIKVLQLVFGPS
jgi:hypothetical protein